jgi:hypothetical protein
VHPVIQTAIATQRIKEMQAEAARAARATRAREARRGQSPRLSWLFDLVGRREAARLAQHGPDFCCPEYLLTGRCAEHAAPPRMAGSSRPS